MCRLSETSSIPGCEPSPAACGVLELERYFAGVGLAVAGASTPMRSSADLFGRLAALAEHQLDDLALELLRRAQPDALAGDLAGDAALSEDRDAVAERDRLVQLVGDEDDRQSGRLQPLEHLLQLGDCLRGEHRGGLVEDQDAGTRATAP